MNTVHNDGSDETEFVGDLDLVEIGNRASWSVTSSKPGNGVELLRDNNTKTYWQSDGHQPHHVDIKFQKKTAIVELQINVDIGTDESYTPKKLCIYAGTGHFDLKEVASEEFNDPRGWQRIGLDPTEGEEVFKAKLLRLSVVSNHQSGRDTHIRQIKIFGPKLVLPNLMV
eukprot:g4012.t1